MPRIESAWLLPTEESIPIGKLSHADAVINFLSGLFDEDQLLAGYCFNDLKNFLKRREYNSLQIFDVVEDYAVLSLRWIKIGNAYGYNDNYTVTIANYDGAKDIIEHYENIGWYVNIVDVLVHTYMCIGLREYEKLDVKEIIKSGANNREKYMSLFSQI